MSLEIWKNKKIFKREINYYKKLINNNFTLKFVTFGNNNDLNFSRELGDIKIFPLFKYFNNNVLTKFIIILISPWVLKDFIKTSDILKTHQISSGIIAILIKFFFKKKVVCRAGWEPTLNFRLWNISYIKYFFYFLNSLITYKYSDKIIVTTNEIKEFVIKKYKIKKDKICVIPNSVDTQKFKKASNIYNNRCINISRFVKQKNLFQLIDVANLTGIDLDIIGDGPLRKDLINYIKKTNSKVKILSPVDYDDVAKVFSNYSSFITCSKIEGSPKAILEAMSCELVVFAISNSGISNIIKNNETGFLAPNKEKLIKLINLNFGNNKKFNTVGKQAREYIESNFSQDMCIEMERKLFNAI